MGRSWFVVSALAAGMLVAVSGTAPASAAGTVLTVGAPGGTPVAVGDVLTAKLPSGGQAAFLTTPTAITGVLCSASSLAATVRTNPLAPGTATAALTDWRFSSCTSGLSGLVINSVTADNLPYLAGFSSSLAVGLTPRTGAPIQITMIGTSGDVAVICVYQRGTSVGFSGTYANADNSIAFVNVLLTKVSGASVCPSAFYYSAKYAPLLDASQSSRRVFVN